MQSASDQTYEEPKSTAQSVSPSINLVMLLEIGAFYMLVRPSVGTV